MCISAGEKPTFLVFSWSDLITFKAPLGSVISRQLVVYTRKTFVQFCNYKVTGQKYKHKLWLPVHVGVINTFL